MRIASITAGAAGMYCGSCMRDNTLVAALGKLGHDALLIPTYTPIRTDETDVSQQRIFYGGINVYLEQKFWLFRHTPRLFDRLFNFRWLLNRVSRFAVRTKYSELGQLTISMLQGAHGKQRKEVAKLTEWLARDVRPDVILLTNALLSGAVPEFRRALGTPVFVTLQGDDIFLDALPAAHRRRCIELIRENCANVAGFICTSRYYADYMAGYLGLPRDDARRIPVSISSGTAECEIRKQYPFTVGYSRASVPRRIPQSRRGVHPASTDGERAGREAQGQRMARRESARS